MGRNAMDRKNGRNAFEQNSTSSFSSFEDEDENANAERG